jgi:hypothetical protein
MQRSPYAISSDDVGSACALPTAVRAPQGSGCACLQVILEHQTMPHELARMHACTHDNCRCSVFALIPSCGGCCSYSRAIPHLFIPSICFCHTLHMMVAATSLWLREGTALLLPLLAYRNVNLVGYTSRSLPCATASTIWVYWAKQGTVAGVGVR